MDYIKYIVTESLELMYFKFLFSPENPPRILHATKTPANFKDGGRVDLHCQASGDSQITYQWFATEFNGYDKDISGSRYTHNQNTGQLIINNLQHGKDSGYFYCVAGNAAGKIRSQRVLIQVSCKSKHRILKITVSQKYITL